MRTKASTDVAVNSCEPLRKAGAAAATAIAPTSVRRGKRGAPARLTPVRTCVAALLMISGKLPLGENTRIPNSTKNGRLLGRPDSAGRAATTLVASDAATPRNN